MRLGIWRLWRMLSEISEATNAVAMVAAHLRQLENRLAIVLDEPRDPDYIYDLGILGSFTRTEVATGRRVLGKLATLATRAESYLLRL